MSIIDDKKKAVAEEIKKSEEASKRSFAYIDDSGSLTEPLNKAPTASGDRVDSSLLSSILSTIQSYELQKSETDKERSSTAIKISIDSEQQNRQHAGVWVPPTGLIPNEVKKRITGVGGDDLTSQIVQARANHISQMSRPRENRFDIGFDLVPKDKSKLPKKEEDMKALMAEVEIAKEILWNCGTAKNIVGEQGGMTFSQYAKMVTRDGQTFGYHATEFIYDDSINKTERKFLAFRPSDAGTIYKTTNFSKYDASRKKAMLKELEMYLEGGIADKNTRQKIKEQILGKINTRTESELIYTQVVGGVPKMFYTSEEMVCHNVYPTTNVEYNGYPLSPIDQALNAITTHISITQHNKMYFEHGRAARGMLVVKSNYVDEKKLQDMRARFNQTINSVRHAHRMPVFGIQENEDITWAPIDNSSRDMEFQFLSDNNSRVIMAAFQMSPDELPGYGHLSRGTNTQALSESSNEFKLTAARDVGIRPLVLDFQDFINKQIMPKINKRVAKLFAFSFLGLDQDDPQKEAARLEQDQNLHASVNDILDSVDKDRLPKEMGGDLIMNPMFWQTVTPYLTVGQIKEFFFGEKNASKDPRYAYIRDPFYFQNLQVQQQEVQMRIQMGMQNIQNQQAAAQQAAGMPVGEGQQQQEQDPEQQEGEDLNRSEDFVTASVEVEALRKKYKK